MKAAIMTVIAALVFTLAGCAQQEKTDTNKVQKPQAPGVSIYIASLQGNIDAVRQHIAAGTDINKKDAYGSTPLIIAITFSRTEVAKALIDAGADLTISNNEGSSPLHVAAFFCRTEIVKALLEKGADKNAKNKAGSTPLASVEVPFEKVKSYYDNIGKALKPLGLNLDYDRIRKTRPDIADLLR